MLFRVNGDSMAPTLAHGDFVIGWRPSRRRPVQVGDVVVVQHPYYGRMIKRVSACRGDGTLSLKGDNAATVASIDMGAIRRDQVLSRARLRISPNGFGVSRLRATPPD